MGAAESAAKTAESTAKIRASFTKINDTLWVLYSAPDGAVTIDIVFFHGLQMGDSKDAFWKTWIVRGSDVAKDGLSEEVWPRKWLSKMPGFSQARMLSVSYNSCIRKVDGQLRMYTLAENLVEDVILGKALIGQNRPVILVGHSWGGLVIKRMVIFAINRRSLLQESTLPFKDVDIGKITNFLKNIRGVYYYATPHNGSRLADLGRTLLPRASPILELLGTLNEDTSIINSEFEQQRKIPAAATGEGLDTPYGWPFFGFKVRVVEPASARHGINQYYTDITANHFDVCKAEGPNSAVIIKLTDFISNNVSWDGSHWICPKQNLVLNLAGSVTVGVSMIGGYFVNHIYSWVIKYPGVLPFLPYILFFGLLCVGSVVRWCSHRRHSQGTQMPLAVSSSVTTLPDNATLPLENGVEGCQDAFNNSSMTEDNTIGASTRRSPVQDLQAHSSILSPSSDCEPQNQSCRHGPAERMCGGGHEMMNHGDFSNNHLSTGSSDNGVSDLVLASLPPHAIIESNSGTQLPSPTSRNDITRLTVSITRLTEHITRSTESITRLELENRQYMSHVILVNNRLNDIQASLERLEPDSNLTGSRVLHKRPGSRVLHKRIEIGQLLGIQNLNNSVWQFHSPASGRIEMEIIFLHGLQPGDFEHAFWETWLVKGSSTKVWPKEWLAQIFPNARILSVTYDSREMKSDGQLTMYSLGENLISDIILDKNHNIGQNCPVFLVGHSFGGIVIKQLVLSAIHRRSILESSTMNQGDVVRINKFYDNLCGVFYYGTPHGGSTLADWASRIPTLPSLFVTLLTTLLLLPLANSP